MIIRRCSLLITILACVTAMPYPYPYPYPYQMLPPPDSRCCIPGPQCMNPCMLPPPPPPPPPPQQQCCMPAPDCQTPCPGYVPYQKSPKSPVVYAPLPGEIVFKLVQSWDTDLLNSESPAFQILEGNIRSAVQTILGPMIPVTNVYFREGYVPGNPPSRPKTVAHMMVNGGSDAASTLEHSVTPDGSFGDGLKVYKDSFNAY